MAEVPREDLERFRRTASPATVLVRSVDTDGVERVSSGFFVSPTGYAVTTLHAIAEGTCVFLRGYRWKRALPAVVVMRHPIIHVGLLRPAGPALDKQAYLGLLPPVTLATATPCLVLSAHDERSGHQYFRQNALGPVVDPWQEAMLDGRSRFGFEALSLLAEVPFEATGAPCFSHRGRVLGMVSFFHNFAAPDGRFKLVQHVVPVTFLRDFLACAVHPLIKELHGDRLQGLATAVCEAGRGGTVAQRLARMRRRRQLRRQILHSVRLERQHSATRRPKIEPSDP